MKKAFRFVLTATLVFTMIFTQVMVSLATKNSVAPAVEKVVKKITDDTNNNKIKDVLEDEMAKASDTDKIPMMVMFNKQLTADELANVKEAIGNFDLTYNFSIIPALAGKMTKTQIDKLSKLGLVKQVEHDVQMHATMSTAKTWFGVSKAVTDFGVDGNADGNLTGYSKNDIVVAVVDTGIDAAHIDLDGGKVIGWKDYVNNRTTPYDDHGHGTHCSGIICGTGEGNSSYKGVAPGVALVGCKVLDSTGNGLDSNVAAAIDWCVANKATYNIKVISMSLGSEGSSDGTDICSVAVNNAVNAGIVCVVAAGNDGPGIYTIGSPGAAANCITVAAMGDIGEKGFFLADFSSRGLTADGRMKPDISAPGYNIMSVKANTLGNYIAMSGTSMATPFCAGTVALMLDANNNLTPAQVKSYITSTAIDFGPEGQDLDYGYGRLDSYAAVRMAGGLTGTGPAVPNRLYKSESLAGTGKYDQYTISVTSTTYPIAITAIMPNWTSSQDFDIYLYNPSGSLVARSEGVSRQETIAYSPTTTGIYTIRVSSYEGSGSYFFDVSTGATSSSFTQTVNQ